MKKALIISSVIGVAAIGLGWWWFNRKDEDCGCADCQEVKKQVGVNGEDSFNTAELSDIRQKLIRRYKAQDSRLKTKRRKKLDVRHKTDRRKTLEKRLPLSYEALYARFKKAQVSVYNPTANTLTAHLWDIAADNQEHQGFNRKDSLALDPDSHIHTQAIAWNPANGCTYVVSQLSNQLTVVSPQKEVVASITLDNRFPGVNSPVALAVNTKEDSSRYGYVYVSSSVADSVSVINPQHQLVEILASGTRPVSLAYNPVTDKLYVANLMDSTVAVFDGESHQVEVPITEGISEPQLVAVNPTDGSIVVANGNQSLLIFEANHSLSATLKFSYSTKEILYHALLDVILLLSEGGLWALTPDISELRLIYEPECESMTYDANSGQLFLSSTVGSLIILDGGLKAVDTLTVDYNSPALTYDQDQALLVAFEPGQVSLHWYGEGEQGLIFDEDYLERREDFQHNPALVNHVKLVASGDVQPGLLKLTGRSVSGKKRSLPISLNDFRSPQHFQNIYQVTALKGSQINGKTGWQIAIAPGQQLTVLVYYEQVRMYHLMPEQARKSIPIM